MKKPILSILFLLSFALYDADLHGEEQHGFKDIPFGASYEEVYKKAEEIQNQYDKEQYHKRTLFKDTDFSRWKTIRLNRRMQLWGLKEKKYVALLNNKYNLGDIKVDVWFSFDHNDEFYLFMFEAERVSANRLETKVYKEGSYLTNVFKAKYGEPSKCYPHPNILNIRQGSVTYLCQWKHAKLKIYTGISVINSKYYATGVVISNPMGEQYIKNRNQKESNGAAKGAESF